MPELNPARLALARRRRGLTKSALAELARLTPRTVLRLESGQVEPTAETLQQIAAALGFPVDFFWGGDISELVESGVTFRSLSAATKTLRESVVAMGTLACLVNDVLERRLRLPMPDVPELESDKPEAAAESLRRQWAMGDDPIGNVLHLLESKGVRVFSLPTDREEVDAFATWRERTPFVFLNTRKSGERGRFDAAHELGHLLMHRRTGVRGRDPEREADAFASAFLMPRSAVLATAPKLVTLGALLSMKARWGVSVAALARRLHDVGVVNDWEYRQLCIEIAGRGWRRHEPHGVVRESSQLLRKAFGALRSAGVSLSDVARECGLSVAEVSALTFGVVPVVIDGGGGFRPGPPARLRLVSDE